MDKLYQSLMTGIARKYAGWASVPLVFLSGCATAPSPTQEEVVADAFEDPSRAIRAEWSSAAESGEVPDGWLTAFNDPDLEEVVGEALQNNLGMRAAAGRVDAAAAALVQAEAAMKPMVGLGAGAGGTQYSGGEFNDNLNVGLSASWEVDVWGKLRSQAAAGEEQLRVSEAEYAFALQSLAAQTAKAWYMASDALQQEELAKEVVTITEQLVGVVEAKRQEGQVSAQDVYLVEADLATAEAAVRSVTVAREQTTRALELLLGRYPAAELEVRGSFVPVPPAIPVGIPSEILERRADLVAAERRVAAAFQGVQAARLAKLPSVSLTATGGGASNDLLNLLNLGPTFFSAGVNFFQPVYTGGALDAQVDIATAQQEQALSAYGQQALVAFGEVENALSGERLIAEREDFLASAVENSELVLELGNTKYEVGQTQLLDLLQLQTRLASARSDLVSAQSARLVNRINLHLALGGDFQPSDN